MRQRAAFEGVGIGGIRPDELRDVVKVCALDRDAVLLHELTVLIDGPDALGLGVGRRNHIAQGDRPHGRCDQMAGKILIVGLPDVFIPVPAVLHVHGGVLHGTAEIGIVPALGGVEEGAPIVRILLEPACNRLMILKRGIVIPAVFQLLQRLIQQEPDITHALVD